jgi:hypothetical protein
MTNNRKPASWCATHTGQQLAYVYFEDEPGREQHPTLTLAEAMDALWWRGL